MIPIPKFFLSLSALLLLVSCASQPADPIRVENAETVSATVIGLDVKKRLVSLRGADGRSATIEVPNDVRNLAQVKVGDQVVVRYYKSIAAAVRAKDAPKERGPNTAESVVNVAEPGAKPAAGAGAVISTSVEVQSVDNAEHSIQFIGADGFLRQVKVEDPLAQRFIATLKKGDLVDLTFTEALAISVTPAP